MNKLIALGASVAILGGAYVASFGLPAALTQMADGRSAAASLPQAAGSNGAGSSTAATAGRDSPARTATGGGSRGAGRATTVVTRQIEYLPYEDILRAIGSATALRSVDVTTQVSGKVIRADLLANRSVTEGDILVALDSRTEALNLESAQAELQQAQDTVTRYERLRANGSATITDVTLSEARVAQQLAQAKVGLAQVALEDRTIRAPISGRLGLSDVDIGDVLTANTTVTTIDNTQALLVEFELPERAIGMLSQEHKIRASTPSFRGKVFEGEITSFDSRIDSVTRSLTVRARIENPDGQLWSGMTFSVRLSHASAPLPVVPATAITWSRTGSSIWIDQDGIAASVPVTILYRRDDQVWIETDLGPETFVVSEGAQKLREGATIVQAGAERGESDKPSAKAGADAPKTRDPA